MAPVIQDDVVQELEGKVQALQNQLAALRQNARSKEDELEDLKALLGSVRPRPAVSAAPPASLAAPAQPLRAPVATPVPSVPPQVAVAASTSIVEWGPVKLEAAPESARSAQRSERRSVRRWCELEIEFTEDTQFFAGFTQDISEGGLFVATYQTLPVGSRLNLTFQLPDGSPITAHGEVRWLRQGDGGETRPGMGIAFTAVPSASMEAIRRFCARHPPLYVEI